MPRATIVLLQMTIKGTLVHKSVLRDRLACDLDNHDTDSPVRIKTESEKLHLIAPSRSDISQILLKFFSLQFLAVLYFESLPLL